MVVLAIRVVDKKVSQQVSKQVELDASKSRDMTKNDWNIFVVHQDSKVRVIFKKDYLRAFEVISYECAYWFIAAY